ncbi:hypothetical protein HBI56_052450 [Parastagonospora nodorum]|nr:hypothetical protein HBH56_099710 [Parastagonospora nodorum]KAH3930233.1 hypothetical protein HBH54_114030 [Parastagonospora nodorum]KAH4070314.1 hypothetical protein HBH50_097250 [Parastagonospora nodorum]KAH4090878.1 hypothetical protein HBH48_101020 [Parastagonospora nodorum]KAH4133495.1 hypothetical protein HBH47_001750 [Parastagonospora nodorum]
MVGPFCALDFSTSRPVVNLARHQNVKESKCSNASKKVSRHWITMRCIKVVSALSRETSFNSKLLRVSTFPAMSSLRNPEQYIENARIAPEVFELRPDYRALLMVVTNIPASPSDATSEAFLSSAETSAKAALSQTPIIDISHVNAWRETYKAFGAKPKKTMNSLEALLRRVDNGLPRVNRLTDIYNAISIKHQIPLGGEDLDKYQGAPFLIRAKGDEKFITKSGGEEVTDHPKPGEVVWCDDGGVTCRLWNWRQCARTALSDATTNGLFIMDALEPMDDEKLGAAADELGNELSKLSSDVKVYRRIVRSS